MMTIDNVEFDEPSEMVVRVLDFQNREEEIISVGKFDDKLKASADIVKKFNVTDVHVLIRIFGQEIAAYLQFEFPDIHIHGLRAKRYSQYECKDRRAVVLN
jgi:hypothetical protein